MDKGDGHGDGAAKKRGPDEKLVSKECVRAGIEGELDSPDGGGVIDNEK